jgi:hypothetical protein
MKISKSQKEYMEQKLAHVEHDRSRPVTQDDVLRIMTDLESSDEDVRANALREVCPCRMSWEIFEQLRKPALRLRKDPSPLVRKLADHVEEDAREVAELEALYEREMEKEDAGRDYSTRPRHRHRGH